MRLPHRTLQVRNIDERTGTEARSGHRIRAGWKTSELTATPTGSDYQTIDAYVDIAKAIPLTAAILDPSELAANAAH